MTEPLFLSVAETAGLLGVSHDLVRDLILRGELPATELGRRKMVPRRAIDLVLERTLEGFDPDALLARLAGADASSAGSAAGEGAPGPTGSTRARPPSDAAFATSSASSGAPALAHRR